MIIWAAEPNKIQVYLEKRESLSSHNLMMIKTSEDNKEQITEQKVLSKSIFDKQIAEELFVIDGTEATIRIIGVLTQDGPDWIDNLFGLAVTGYNQLLEAIDLIKSTEGIKVVNLEIDSPGGEAAGCDLVCQALVELGKKVSLKAFNFGMIASAAYWLATAADEIIAVSPTNETGSIGVLITGFDFSERWESMGIKFVKIRSANAPKKAPGISTDADIKLLQERIDPLERVFLARVAEGRNTTVKDVITNFGRGAVLIAQDPDKKMPDAVSVGMIDSVQSLLMENNNKKKTIKSNHLKEDKMDLLTQLLSDNPGLQAHLDKIETDAYQKGVNETEKVVSVRVAAAKKVLEAADDVYGTHIKQLALRVVTGDAEISSLDSCVTMRDSELEKIKSEAAAKETDALDETPANLSDKDKDGVINDEASYKAEMKKIKDAQGGGQ